MLFRAHLLYLVQKPMERNKVLRIIHAGILGRERNPEILLKGIRSFLDKVSDAQIEITFWTYWKECVTELFLSK